MTKFYKYPKIPYLEEIIDKIGDKYVYIFEKLDGANCQVRKVMGRIIPAVRSGIATKQKAIGPKKWINDFLRWVYSNQSLYNLPENYILYGEWLSLHTIEYDKENMNKFYFIDLFDINKRRFVFYDKAVNELRAIGVNEVVVIPILYKGKFDKSIVQRLLKEPSLYYGGPKEGLVIKDYENQIFAKHLHPTFTEIREKEKDPILRYFTAQRVRKAIQNCAIGGCNEGLAEGLKMKDKHTTTIIQKIIKIILKDIEEETGVKITFKDLKKRGDEIWDTIYFYLLLEKTK